MKYSWFIKIFFSLTLLSACTLVDHKHADKIWFFTYYTGQHSAKDSVLTPASFINLQQDGNYTSELEKFEYGKWKIENKTLYLAAHNNKITSIRIEYLTNTEARLSSTEMPTASFDGLPGLFKTPADNPFLRENNLWRIPALRKESDSEIRSRLINHMRFWELYFLWALNSDISSIDVRSTPTPIKIYGNGFALKSFANLPQQWKSYFFDEEDCRKANEIINAVFNRKNIAWAHTDNKYKFFISAFQQLQQQIK